MVGRLPLARRKHTPAAVRQWANHTLCKPKVHSYWQLSYVALSKGAYRVLVAAAVRDQVAPTAAAAAALWHRHRCRVHSAMMQFSLTLYDASDSIV
jgi:hypothetical protein